MIDSVLQQSLRDRYNPEGSELRKNQESLLKILKKVVFVCEKNDIPYWLSSGTLLGAIRHGGFIPWDDDIDIEILYKDRHRFIEACNKDLPSDLVVQTHKSDSHHYSSIIKIKDLNSTIHEYYMGGNLEYPLDVKYKGFYIDVFTEESSFLPFIKFSNKLIGIINRSHFMGKRPDWYCNLLSSFSKPLFVVFRVISSLFGDESIVYHSYGSGYNSCRLINDIFPLGMADFEGSKFRVPGNYDHYLKTIFGNYQTIPDSKTIETVRHIK